MVAEKTYKSSSAAYRAIRHYESKTGKRDLIMEKMIKGVYKVKQNEINLDEFIKTTPNVKYDKLDYRYFGDGVNGAGYYELKIGNRRRPNSLFKTSKEMYNSSK